MVDHLDLMDHLTLLTSTLNIALSLLAILMVDAKQEQQHLQILTPELFSIFLLEVK